MTANELEQELDPGEPRRHTREAARSAGSDLADLQALSVPQLVQLATRKGIASTGSRQELVFALLQAAFAGAGVAWGEGVLEVLPEGFGFLRARSADYRPGADDVFVSQGQVQRLHLRSGHLVSGPLRPPRPGEKYFALLQVDRIDDEVVRRQAVVPFEALTPLLPRSRLRLDHDQAGRTARALDLLAPWGRGQRVLLAAPVHADRLRLLCEAGEALLHNHDDLTLLFCLLDQRPEDAASLRQHFRGRARAEVAATTFDEAPERHTALATTVLGRARRLVERGRHVVLMLDSLTRLVRAWHLELPHSGRILTAGLDAAALQQPKQLFAAARSTEEGGSLTVIASVLTGTASRVDEVIADEFRGHGNSEVVLGWELIEPCPFPPIDVVRTGTRREDCLLSPAATQGLLALRRELLQLPPMQRLERLAALFDGAVRNDAILAQGRAT